MKVRRKGLATVGAAFALAALVAMIGAAQAAPSTKIYDATVRVVAGPATTLQLKLTNAAGSKQTLGSANFTAPSGYTEISVVPSSVTGSGAFLVTAEGNVVKFRSTVPLKKTESVSANVLVTTTSSCQDATWTVQSKQSNDFSGSGNDFTQGTSTNRRPLGSLAIADIGTEVDDPDSTATVFVPQIKVSVQEDLAVTAKDICGAAYANYGLSPNSPSFVFGASATLARKAATPPRLVNATLTQPAWTSGTGTGAGTGTAALTPAPADVETGDHLVLSDQFTSIKAESNEFDVVETICTSFDDTCHWNNGNDTIRVDAPSPPLGASLGVGFSSDLSGFSCNNETDLPVGETLIYVNPRDYPQNETQSVTFTYDNTIPGTSGNLENFQVCMSKGNGAAGSWFPVLDCESDPADPTEPTPCVEDRGRLQGDIFVTIFLDPTVDPAGGMT